jgi:hypothetical protein
MKRLVACGHTWPVIDPNYLDDPYDLHAMLVGMRWNRRILTANAFTDVVGEELTPGVATQNDEELTEHIRTDDVASCWNMQDGNRRDGSRGPEAAGARGRVISSCGCLHHADYGQRQYQCPNNDDCGEGQ